MIDEKSEYRRIKKFIHEAALLQTHELLNEIEEFGTCCKNRNLYKSLKWKYRWHRIVKPVKVPVGKPTDAWLECQPKPLVSVIVPNYCHSAYLSERIDCILNQTFQNFEVILLDDCSTDGSSELLLSYKKHPKVAHVILNDRNSGNTFLQWEKGISVAKGKYIWIAESDDYADEEFLEAVMAVFSLHEDCVMVRTGSYQVNERGRVLVRDWDIWKEDETMHYYLGSKYIRHNLLHFNFLYNASMIVFRKDAFTSLDKCYQSLRYTGDWLCWIELLSRGNVCEYRRKLNYFRQHANKVSTRSDKTSLGVLDQIQVMAYVLTNLKLSLLRKILIRGEQYRLVYRTNFADDEDRAKAIRILTEDLHASKKDYLFYRFVSAFDFLPFIPSAKNDKLR